jgi:hypothetical protein
MGGLDGEGDLREMGVTRDKSFVLFGEVGGAMATRLKGNVDVIDVQIEEGLLAVLREGKARAVDETKSDKWNFDTEIHRLLLSSILLLLDQLGNPSKDGNL